ncbi:hypothetical protein G6L37_34190 [Agrobacterium rubi]|uniref:hypothetical protein n=1 Tax=Agrobacterium rubi TaxID=28099 RepID=UPI0015742677|nr:hypothetical protein [Agrobacterium rubi]NTF11091.1 hypothetical protein [Agrobacterium rubi]NTF23430.1 hypothetical protein [Agrobacterium rubi]NTF30430.1 hypothetical protein [Agrobacterium rubi]
MKILRFGEPHDNSSFRAIRARVKSCEALSADLRTLIPDRRLPDLDPGSTPIIEQWAIENYMAPMLTGYIHYPGSAECVGSEWLGFTMPIELLSVAENAARSMSRWYRLGTPSPFAADTVKAWGGPHER